MKLVIVESPSKAKTIQKYLGADFKVMASGGHICDLPEKSLGIDVNNNYKPEYILNDSKKDLIKRLKYTIKDSERVYLATDPDREGEAISWHLANNLGIKEENRIEFNEISQKAVRQAIQNPRRINVNLVNAQQARRVLDRLVGYKVSPIVSKKIKGGLSGGRVQSAALKMIVDREREIRAFIPEEYWNIYALLHKETDIKKQIKCLLSDKKGAKLKVSDAETAEAIVKELQTAQYFVEKIKRGVSRSRPQPPFMTSTLQQDGSQKLGISAPQVMQLAQQLYEGIEIPGEGHTAFITYIRTDSVRVSPDMQTETLKYIREKYGDEYAPLKPNFYATKGQNTQDAHEAIRPNSLDRHPDSIKDKVSRNLYRLYKLIYDRFVASQMTDAVYNTLTVRVQADTQKGNSYGFKINGKTLVFKGYTAVYDSDSKTDDEEIQSNIPDLKEGEKLALDNLTSEQKFTKAPSRYTDATLVKAMEENGIGRPSTYASVISVLDKREYTVKEQKMIVPTALGETVTEFMENFFANIVDVHFTAEMEEKLDMIERGSVWQEIISDFYPKFMNDVYRAYKDENNKMSVPDEVSDVICEKCGGRMVIKEGRYGKFLACPNFPKCRNIKSFVEKLGDCPKCKKGSVVKLYTKNKKMFYGCSNYPECGFMSWDLPAPILCPKCESIMKVTENGGDKQYVCTNYKCKHTVSVNEEGKD